MVTAVPGGPGGPVPALPAGGGGAIPAQPPGGDQFNFAFGGSVGIALTSKAIMLLLFDSLVCVYLFIF